MNHVMIDLETLGTNPNAPITSIGTVFFEPTTGELGKKLYFPVDFEDDIRNGAVPDGGCVNPQMLAPNWFVTAHSRFFLQLLSLVIGC